MYHTLVLRHALPLIVALQCLSASAQTSLTGHVVLITLDGYRWQEMFAGPQKQVVRSKRYTKDSERLKALYMAKNGEGLPHMVMPFLWKQIKNGGAICGNRKLHSKVVVTNGHNFSYPGYNEIFSGWGNKKVNSNDYPDNPNLTLFDFLNSRPEFAGQLAAVATWDAFPRIINTKRNGVPVFTNFRSDSLGNIISNQTLPFQTYTTTVPRFDHLCQSDTLTYKVAKEYMARYQPKFMFIGFDETDHFGHTGQYDNYIHAAHTADRYIEDLWNFLQTLPQYKDNTSFIITSDHGRGRNGAGMWRHHGQALLGARNIWIASFGKGIAALGEEQDSKKHYQNQIAATVAKLFGIDYTTDHRVGSPITDLLQH